MWLAVLYMWGSLIAFSKCDICPEPSQDAASWVELKPLDNCGDEDNLCPYQLILPPFSIQLPKPFREMEKMAKEFQDLKEVVNELRRQCQECKDKHIMERSGRKDHIDEEIVRPQNTRHNISKGTQSHNGEQVVRIFTSTMLQGDTSERDGTAMGGVKKLNHSVLEHQGWNTDLKIGTTRQGTTDQRSEINRELKIFNHSLEETPRDISEVKLVLSPTPEEKSELREPSLSGKNNDGQTIIHRKLQPNVLRDGHVKNTSGILTARRRTQNVADMNGLRNISRDVNTKTIDLGTSPGNKRVVKIPVLGGPLRPKGSYINSRIVKVNNEDRHNPALVKKTIPQSGDTVVKIEEAGFSPARSGAMRVKETGSHTANSRLGAIKEPTLQTDDRKKQDISRGFGIRADDRLEVLKDARQVTVKDNLKKVSTTEITSLPTNLRKDKQSDVHDVDTNKTSPSIIKQAEQPIVINEEKKHVGLGESLVVISSKEETSANVDRKRQMENEQHINPITENNNRQIDSINLDKADGAFKKRTVNPVSHDFKDKVQPGTFTEGASEEIVLSLPSTETVKKDNSRDSKAMLLEKDHVKPTFDPTVNSEMIDSSGSMTFRAHSPVRVHGTRRTPLDDKNVEEKSQNSKKNISKTREVSQDNRRYKMPSPLNHPKLRQPNIMDKTPTNRTVVAASKVPIQVKNSTIARKNGTRIISSSYTWKKPNAQTETKINKDFKTKVSPTVATSTIAHKLADETERIPQVMSSNVLNNHWLKINITNSKSQSDSQSAGDVEDLDKIRQSENTNGSKSKMEVSNTRNHAEHYNTESRSLNSPAGVKESQIFISGEADANVQKPFEVDKMSSEKKRPAGPTFKKDSPMAPGTTSSFTNADHKDIKTVTTTDVKAKNRSQDMTISFEDIRETTELERIDLKDKVEENPGEILPNTNIGDTAQIYSGERYAIPVVLETRTNVEEIKGSKLFSLSPKDTVEGFKSHAVSDEVTERDQESKSSSTCHNGCNTTPTHKSSTQTRPPLESGKDKGPAQDCADYATKTQRNGVYRVTPRWRNSSFPVFCDMESSGGGWTLIQHRLDGSTSFNRTWDEYKNGFGKLTGEFWLGNDKIHFLTKAKNMSLRIEIKDVEGNKEYAHYDHFYVSNESQQYRLSIGGYSGTAGNAMQFSKKYNHDQKLFTTPDRDNDQYPSGNCGAYYSSGWWFDACMSANLNGKYYQSKYKGVRNGIFWGTWHNITMEYYPTNDRQAFKTIRMMIRPENYVK